MMLHPAPGGAVGGVDVSISNQDSPANEIRDRSRHWFVIRGGGLTRLVAEIPDANMIARKCARRLWYSADGSRSFILHLPDVGPSGEDVKSEIQVHRPTTNPSLGLSGRDGNAEFFSNCVLAKA